MVWEETDSEHIVLEARCPKSRRQGRVIPSGGFEKGACLWLKGTSSACLFISPMCAYLGQTLPFYKIDHVSLGSIFIILLLYNLYKDPIFK